MGVVNFHSMFDLQGIMAAALIVLVIVLIVLKAKDIIGSYGFSSGMICTGVSLLLVAFIPFPGSSVTQASYDAVAKHGSSTLFVQYEYATSRDLSAALGRPVGNAQRMTCDNESKVGDAIRPVVYLADDGVIRHGKVKLTGNGKSWTAALYDSKGKPVHAPAGKISAPSYEASDDRSADRLAVMSDNGVKGCGLFNKYPESGETEATFGSDKSIKVSTKDVSSKPMTIYSTERDIKGQGNIEGKHLLLLDGRWYVVDAVKPEMKPIRL